MMSNAGPAEMDGSLNYPTPFKSDQSITSTMTYHPDPRLTPPKDISHASTPTQSRPQILLVLVGLPGSGKTTFSEALVSQSHQRLDSRKWIRASQDDSPSRRRQECEAVVRQALQGGYNVVVDRVDFDPVQRSHFINIALSHIPPPKIYCLILSVSRTTLEKRLEYRPDHPTIPDLETGLRVLSQMHSQYRPPNPQEAEGFDRIYELSEGEQPVDGIWTNTKLEEVLGKIESDGLREVGERKVYMPGGNGFQNYGRGSGSWSGRGRSDGVWSRGRGGYSSGLSSRDNWSSGNGPDGGSRNSSRGTYNPQQQSWNRGAYRAPYRGRDYHRDRVDFDGPKSQQPYQPRPNPQPHTHYNIEEPPDRRPPL